MMRYSDMSYSELVGKAQDGDTAAANELRRRGFSPPSAQGSDIGGGVGCMLLFVFVIFPIGAKSSILFKWLEIFAVVSLYAWFVTRGSKWMRIGCFVLIAWVAYQIAQDGCNVHRY
jgi:hypothetical protein